MGLKRVVCPRRDKMSGNGFNGKKGNGKPICFTIVGAPRIFRVYYFSNLDLLVRVGGVKAIEEFYGFQPSELRVLEKDKFEKILETYEVI